VKFFQRCLEVLPARYASLDTSRFVTAMACTTLLYGVLLAFWPIVLHQWAWFFEGIVLYIRNHTDHLKYSGELCDLCLCRGVNIDHRIFKALVRVRSTD